MKTFKFINFFLILISFFCVSQEKNQEIYIQEIENNKELKYVLTYAESIIRKNDTNQNFFLKGLKLPSNTEIPEEDGHEKMEYFYFFVSSYDEYPEIEGKLYKTISFINPNLISVSFEERMVLIKIEVVEKELIDKKDIIIKIPLY
ncbi:hypothetical protein [Formosa maritima]|uniref:Lipoprotein n=1 Tax=Formosa maritima TaxID=2592046 RepID=A0A5D0G1R9_9FLAO|nr:hypothetical protein [Formosa maritima]TYA52259.1 hypothetical protein FVF61_13025 [Formosa maritima]